jgi:hypothetical protein
VSGVDEQLAQVGVAGLPVRTPGRCGDSELWILVAGLVPLGDEAEGGSDLAALAKAAGTFKCQHEGQSCEGADTADLGERPSFGIALLAELLDLLVVVFDLLGEGADRIEDGQQGRG